ncbi:hypothetical protein B0H11DRAFT_2007108 [Mycena galericulata]|nr:hypothetical protein B0H11DRAFT_2007108 [Mycena galericulata]
MESEANPLNISELVDHTISFLTSPDDFRACALVSRSWVHPAQFRIFSKLEISSNRNDKSLSRLLAILEDSPHLAGFISTLTIRIVVIEPSYLSRLSVLPYRRLTALSITCGNRLGFKESLALQQILSVPSLISAAFSCAFERREDFLRIWERCSGNIKHYSHWPLLLRLNGSSSSRWIVSLSKAVNRGLRMPGAHSISRVSTLSVGLSRTMTAFQLQRTRRLITCSCFPILTISRASSDLPK